MQTLLRLPKVLDTTGKTRASVYADIKKGTFPEPVKIGERAVAWRSIDVQAWIDSRPGTGKLA